MKNADALNAKRYIWLRDHAPVDLRSIFEIDGSETLDAFIDRRLDAERKFCHGCQSEKSIADFYRTRKGHSGHCKACQKGAAIRWREAKKAGADTARKPFRRLSLDEITADLVRSTLAYNPETGEFSCKIKRGKSLPGSPVGTVDPKGYLRISVYGRIITAHRLAWLISYGEWPQHVINHKNGKKLDNRLANLEDIPSEENTRHAHRTGLIKVPGNKSTVKLKPWQAIEIRQSTLPRSDLARRYGISVATVADIQKGRTWVHATHLASGGTLMSGGPNRLRVADAHDSDPAGKEQP